MLVKDLINTLKKFPEGNEVLIEDNDRQSSVAIGGITLEKALDAMTSEEKEFVVLKKPVGEFNVL